MLTIKVNDKEFAAFAKFNAEWWAKKHRDDSLTFVMVVLEWHASAPSR